ncbi:S41 family peptidase [Desulfobulbus sp. F5]|nr:S41 family peptidase [Desulfobulbus sp. F5]
MKHSLLRHCVVAAFFAALSAAPLAAEVQKNQTPAAEIYSNLETFATILDMVQKHYVEETRGTDILAGAVNGMLGTLDPHSSYLSPKDFKELQEDTSGSFSGVGIEVTVRDGLLIVVSPIVGTPAYFQGIKAGDQIVKINGQATADMNLNDAIMQLRGKIGEKVTLTVSREGQPQSQDIVLIRSLIPQHSIVAAELAPGLHHIQITNFQADTVRDFKDALSKAAKKRPVTGLLLDLRNDPGGLLEQAVSLADLFIQQGLIVSTKGRDKEQDMLFEARSGIEKYAFPMVVLVNEGSASAAEIVAGALQDHKRALILGTKTFGKGSVQTVVPLPNGAGLRLTTARYYTPNGRSIQETGIEPDIVVPLEESEEVGKQQIREKDLHHHFENKELKKKDKKKGGQKEDAQQIKKDNQLSTALFILQHLPQ